MLESKGEHFFLPNKLEVLVLPFPFFESVSIGLAVKAGVRFEDAAVNGISHFLEHLIFKGSRFYPHPLQIATRIESLGGIVNAYTAEDHTLFWTKLGVEHWREGLKIILDAVFYPRLPREGIEVERKVILQEIARRDDNPQELVWEAFAQALWPQSNLGRSILGPPEVIKHLQRDDFLQYRKKFYHPANMVLIVVGPLKAAAVAEWATDFLQEIPFQEERIEEKRTYRQKKPHLVIKNKSTEQVHLVLGWRGLSLDSEQRYPASLLASILGRGMSSRLFREIREKQGLVYTIYSSVEFFEDTGFLAVYAGLAPRNLKKGLRRILQEFEKVQEEEVSADELAAAKEKIIGPFKFNLESTDGWMRYWAPRLLLQKKAEDPTTVIKKINQVTAKEIQSLARQLCRPQRLSLALVNDHCREDDIYRLLS